MTAQSVTLVYCGQFEKNFLNEIAGSITREYSMPVAFSEDHSELSIYYNPARKQYDANELLKFIATNHPADTKTKTIGLFRVDIFIPILTYIYGQAFLNGNTGVASMYRLKNELYGLKQDDRLLLQRFSKVIIHELGHTFGLKHCHTPDCVMLSSTYVEDIDQKSKHLCLHCREILHHL